MPKFGPSASGQVLRDEDFAVGAAGRDDRAAAGQRHVGELLRTSKIVRQVAQEAKVGRGDRVPETRIQRTCAQQLT